MSLSRQNIVDVVVPMVRKYDWAVDYIIGVGYKITVTDGASHASIKITEGEDIAEEVQRLIDAVDRHEYKDLE